MEKWEEKLPPRVRERLAKIKITPEDRKRIKSLEKLKSLLSEFYRGKLSPDDLAEKLKECQAEEKEFLIKEVQLRLIDSFSLQISSPDFKKRGKGILVLERLKTHGKHSLIKTEINSLGSLIKRYLEEKNKIYEQLKKEIEDNPQLRIRQVKTEDGEILIQLSVDEATRNSPQWKDFISRHEAICGSEFARSIERLKGMVT